MNLGTDNGQVVKRRLATTPHVDLIEVALEQGFVENPRGHSTGSDTELLANPENPQLASEGNHVEPPRDYPAPQVLHDACEFVWDEDAPLVDPLRRYRYRDVRRLEAARRARLESQPAPVEAVGFDVAVDAPDADHDAHLEDRRQLGPVSQALLRRYRRLRDRSDSLLRRCRRLRQQILDRIDAGLGVEGGLLRAEVRRVPLRRLSVKTLTPILGADGVRELQARIEPVEQCQLIVRNRQAGPSRAVPPPRPPGVGGSNHSGNE